MGARHPSRQHTAAVGGERRLGAFPAWGERGYPFSPRRKARLAVALSQRSRSHVTAKAMQICHARRRSSGYRPVNATQAASRLTGSPCRSNRSASDSPLDSGEPSGSRGSR